MKIVTVAQMRSIERSCESYGISIDDLMERAGLAVARESRAAMGGAAGKRVLVLVGPGNNGGDGLVAARHLARWGAQVTAYLAAPRRTPDPKLDLALEEEVELVSGSTDKDFRRLEMELGRCRLIIDAVLGTGTLRPLEGQVKEVVARLYKRRGVLLALDLPTGVDADTGRADPASPKADVTVCLGFPKVGLLQPSAAETVGRLEVVDMGIPPELAQDISIELLTRPWIRSRLPSRPLAGHKGTFGHALIIGGSFNYPGAACLAAQGALVSGAGLVTLATPQSIQPILAARPTEAIHLPLPDDGLGTLGPIGAEVIRNNLSQYGAVVLGCGIGRSYEAQAFLERLILAGPPPSQPLVIDADGLNNLSAIGEWWNKLRTPTILTPHPGEMSRLTEIPTSEVQACRIRVAREWAEKWGKVVVLKGAFTVIASPGNRCWVSPFANPILATGGTGDVLAGMIAGLLAQGLSLEEAACCGVYLHGAAADLQKETFGDRGATAGDLLKTIPLAIKSALET